MFSVYYYRLNKTKNKRKNNSTQIYHRLTLDSEEGCKTYDQKHFEQTFGRERSEETLRETWNYYYEEWIKKKIKIEVFQTTKNFYKTLQYSLQVKPEKRDEWP